jgi:hypothetical protein
MAVSLPRGSRHVHRTGHDLADSPDCVLGVVVRGAPRVLAPTSIIPRLTSQPGLKFGARASAWVTNASPEHISAASTTRTEGDTVGRGPLVPRSTEHLARLSRHAYDDPACGTHSSGQSARSHRQLHYPSAHIKKGRMHAPSCQVSLLVLQAGYVGPSGYFPGFGLLLCPGGTPGAELEHTPPSWSVHFVPLGAVHANALGAVAPTNTAAPRRTPRMRFFITQSPLASRHLPPAPPRTSPRAYSSSPSESMGAAGVGCRSSIRGLTRPPVLSSRVGFAGRDGPEGRQWFGRSCM